MDAVDIHDAKARLSQLVDHAASGEDVVISRHGKPLVRITQLEAPAKGRVRFGLLKGRVKLAENFDAALSPDVLSGFQGS